MSEPTPGTTPTRRPSVTYSHAAEGYFEKRQLKRTAGFWGIWGIGIAAVISGDYSGWSYGFGEAGFGGMVIATALIVVMYFGLLFSIGEMSAAMPHTGGAYSFARSAMGPWGGFITGLAETIEYVFTTGVCTLFAAAYANVALDEIFGFTVEDWVMFAIIYGVFVAFNSLGAAAGFRFAIVASVITIGVIVAFAVIAIVTGSLDTSLLNDVKNEDGEGGLLPFGVSGIFYAMPFAIWLFLGIEELPLAAEEAHDPERDIPRASLWAYLTLIGTGVIVLFGTPLVAGAAATGANPDGTTDDEPLLTAFYVIFDGKGVALLSIIACFALLTSLQGILYAAGRNMYSLSRAGYYPKGLSVTGSRNAPWLALTTVGVIGFAACVIASRNEDAAAIVLYIAVWGAVLSYMLQMTSYVLLRRKYPNARRPYVSPWKEAGAVVAGLIALATFIAILLNADFRTAVYAIVVIYVVGLLAFGLWGRHRLVLSPEEEYAMSGGLHRDPAVEHYGSELEAELPPEDFTK